MQGACRKMAAGVLSKYVEVIFQAQRSRHGAIRRHSPAHRGMINPGKGPAWHISHFLLDFPPSNGLTFIIRHTEKDIISRPSQRSEDPAIGVRFAHLRH
jgi:hypothetical protein